MSGCERFSALVAFLTLLGCSDPDACLRHSDCPSGQGCTAGKCAFVAPPADADTDALDARADADADARDGNMADREASSDATGERDAADTGAIDAANDVLDASDAPHDGGDAGD
jgi:hypothetical protein